MENKPIYKNNMESLFIKANNSIKFDHAKQVISDSDVSNLNDLKMLTINIMDITKSVTINCFDYTNDIEKCVEDWAINNLNKKNLNWQKELKDYCKSHLDINNIYVLENSEFIIVVENVVNDTIFEYNDFCFSLAEKHEDIINFMIIDQEEAVGSHDLLQSYKMIYKRGN